jgi:hypothetical protein
MTESVDRDFEGPFKESLKELAGLIDWLRAEHDKSFVKAGDDKVYAFGGDGYIVVLDESVWSGLIEVVTPKGGVAIKPGDDGKLSVTSTVEGEQAIRQVLQDGIEGVRRSYENRYWSTPKTATS